MEKTIPKAKGREVMKTVSLIDLCYSVTDCSHSTPKWTNAGKIVIRNQNIRNGRLDISSVSYTTQEDYDKRIKRALPNAGDIIITREAPMGEVCMIPDDLECCLGQRMVLLKPNRDLVDNNYLLYALMSPYVQNQISWSEGTGTTVSNLRIPHLEKLQIPIFELKKQRKIAKLLANLDKKIEVNNEMNDNLQQQAFALFDNLMVDADNDICTVADYAYLNPRRVLSKGQIARSIDMSQLSTSGAFPSGWDMKPYNGGMRFTNGDTILARITPCLENGKTAFIDFLDKGEVAFGSTEYIVLAPRDGVPPEMLYCLARYLAFVDYAVKNMNGSSGRQRVSAETIGQFQLHKLDEQNLATFRKAVTPMFLKMRYNSFENTRLVELRDTLLPKLMSDELDVSSIKL